MASESLGAKDDWVISPGRISDTCLEEVLVYISRARDRPSRRTEHLSKALTSLSQRSGQSPRDPTLHHIAHDFDIDISDIPVQIVPEQFLESYIRDLVEPVIFRFSGRLDNTPVRL